MDLAALRRERELRRGVPLPLDSPASSGPTSTSAFSSGAPPPAGTAAAGAGTGGGGVARRVGRVATIASTNAAAAAPSATATAAERQRGGGGEPLDQVAGYLGIAGKTVTVPPIPALGFTVPSVVPLIHFVLLGVGVAFLIFRGRDPIMVITGAAVGCYMIISSAAAARQ